MEPDWTGHRGLTSWSRRGREQNSSTRALAVGLFLLALGCGTPSNSRRLVKLCRYVGGYHVDWGRAQQPHMV